MSDSFLRLIPIDPKYVPNQQAQSVAEELLLSLGQWNEEISSKCYEEIIFVDQGENFERIVCPLCKTELDINWWQEAMSEASENKFMNLEISLPCCKQRSSLNELEYLWPAGFSRFVIEARNPKSELNATDFESLEKILNCKLRKIIANY